MSSEGLLRAVEQAVARSDRASGWALWSDAVYLSGLEHSEAGDQAVILMRRRRITVRDVQTGATTTALVRLGGPDTIPPTRQRKKPGKQAPVKRGRKQPRPVFGKTT